MNNSTNAEPSQDTPTLPDVPSELLRLALKDLEAVEALPEVYRVDMGQWHTSRKRLGVCDVCFAGAVLAQALRTSETQLVDDFHEVFDVHGDKLTALDFVGQGDIYDFLHHFQEGVPPGVPRWIDTCSYSKDPQQFKADMHSIADLLEEHGL